MKCRRWRTKLSYPWRYHAHINELEAATVLIALRWFVIAHGGGCRVVLLSDSAVFLGVLETGRSSHTSVMRYARHVGAILLTHDIDLLLINVPTDVNPADGPSRTLLRPRHVFWP